MSRRRDFLWTATGRVFVQLAQLLSIVVLARVLTPADFGLGTVTAAMVAIATLIADLGISTAAVHFWHRSSSWLGTALTLNIASSLLTGGALVGLSGFLADHMGGEALQPLLIVAAAGVALSPWSVPLGSLAAQERYKAIISVEVAGAFLAVLVSFVFAKLGSGALSLALGPALSSIAQAAGFFLLARQRADLRWDMDWARSLLGYGLPLAGASTLSIMSADVDRLILASRASPSSVGIYSRASQLALLPNSVVQSVVHRVLLPRLSLASGDPAERTATWRRITEAAMLLTCEATAVACTTAAFIVHFLLGDQWLRAVDPLVILLAAAPFVVYQGLVAVYLQAIARTGLQLRLGALGAALTATAALVCAGPDIETLALAVTASSVAATTVWVHVMRRTVGGPVWPFAAPLVRPLLAGVLVAGGCSVPLLVGDGTRTTTFLAQAAIGAVAMLGTVGVALRHVRETAR